MKGLDRGIQVRTSVTLWNTANTDLIGFDQMSLTHIHNIKTINYNVVIVSMSDVKSIQLYHIIVSSALLPKERNFS